MESSLTPTTFNREGGMHQEAGFRPELVDRSVIPPGSVVMGVPGKAQRLGNSQDFERICRTAMHYVQAARQLRKQRGT